MFRTNPLLLSFRVFFLHLSLHLCYRTFVFHLFLHPTSTTVFRLLFLSIPNSLLPLSHSPCPPILRYRPPYFRLLLLFTHPRVSLAYFLRTPRILRVTRLGPPEKVGHVNCVHGNRACSNPCSFLLLSIEKISPPSFPLYSSLPTYNNTV